MRVRDIMTQDVLVVVKDTSAQEAAHLLEKHSISALPVLGKGLRLIGMVRQKDLEKASAGANVALIMDVRVVSVSPDTDVRQAVRLMTQENVRSMAVVQGERLVGIVALSDLNRRPEATVSLRAHKMVGVR